jgi:ABC-type multidrug transport system ATPase subunit
VLLSSHHLGEVDRACARILFLNDGALLADQDAGELHARTRRLVRLAWSAGTDASAFAARLESLGAARVRTDGARASATLREPDPRPFLGALAAARDLPAPDSAVYGELSLAELYRDLYGVEGV